MTKIICIFIVAIGLSLVSFSQQNSTNERKNTVKMNVGIITTKLAETKEFYAKNFGFGVTFENEFYLLMHTPNKRAEISFLLPNHSSQQPLFHKPFSGEGVYLTIEVEDVDKFYKDLKGKGVRIKVELRDEPWGDRHFAVTDPNGVNIDIVKFSPPAAR